MQLFLLRVTISRAVFAVVAMAGISPLLAADPARKSEAPKVLVIGYSDANLDGVMDAGWPAPSRAAGGWLDCRSSAEPECY